MVPSPAAGAGSSRWQVLPAIADKVAGVPVDLTCDTMDDTYDGGDTLSAYMFASSRSDWAPSRINGYTFPLSREVTLSQLACAGLLTAYLHPRPGLLVPYLWRYSGLQTAYLSRDVAGAPSRVKVFQT